MKRFIPAAAIAAALVTAAPAAAITNGAPDGGGHPAVGGLVADHAYSDGTWIYCSGTLIAPKVFLTAAHCAEASPSVRVSFSSAYKDGDTVYTGTFHGDPAYSQTQSDPHDIAVVVLDKAVKITPSKLPKANSLSSLPKDQQFTSVGYGAYTVTNTQGAGGHTFVYNDVRGVATGTLNSINASWLRISMNPSTGNGGTCYGDSGGPNYLGTTNIIAATTITGDAVCRSTNVDYRLDTASARGFLGQYVILP
ncbi:MAG: hypothetical protein QOE28_249 [Solirubrobacteraceae bacterium]|nr:hypothetical protein [Solirubrobacteraceae bacterium]